MSKTRKLDLPVLCLHHQREATPGVRRTLLIQFSGLPKVSEIQLEVVSHRVNVATGAPHSETANVTLPDRACTSDTPCSVLWTLDAAMRSALYYLRVKRQAGNILWENPNRPASAALDTWHINLIDYVVRIIYATLFPFARGQNALAMSCTSAFWERACRSTICNPPAT